MSIDKDYFEVMTFALEQEGQAPIHYAIGLDGLLDPYLDKEGWEGIDRDAVKRAIARRLAGVELFQVQRELEGYKQGLLVAPSTQSLLFNLQECYAALAYVWAAFHNDFTSDSPEWAWLTWLFTHEGTRPEEYYRENPKAKPLSRMMLPDNIQQRRGDSDGR